MSETTSMKEYIYLGSSPTDELCVQTTDPDYEIKAIAECARYADQLRRLYSAAHGGRECPAVIRRKSEAHDFGRYFEVVAVASDEWPGSQEAALWLEENLPSGWNDG